MFSSKFITSSFKWASTRPSPSPPPLRLIVVNRQRQDSPPLAPPAPKCEREMSSKLITTCNSTVYKVNRHRRDSPPLLDYPPPPRLSCLVLSSAINLIHCGNEFRNSPPPAECTTLWHSQAKIEFIYFIYLFPLFLGAGIRNDRGQRRYSGPEEVIQ